MDIDPTVCHVIRSEPYGSFLCLKPAVAVVDDITRALPVCEEHLDKFIRLGRKYEPLPEWQDQEARRL